MNWMLHGLRSETERKRGSVCVPGGERTRREPGCTRRCAQVMRGRGARPYGLRQRDLIAVAPPFPGTFPNCPVCKRDREMCSGVLVRRRAMDVLERALLHGRSGHSSAERCLISFVCVRRGHYADVIDPPLNVLDGTPLCQCSGIAKGLLADTHGVECG